MLKSQYQVDMGSALCPVNAVYLSSILLGLYRSVKFWTVFFGVIFFENETMKKKNYANESLFFEIWKLQIMKIIIHSL